MNITGYFRTVDLLQGQSNSGQMFDIIAKTPVFIYAFDMHISDSNETVNVNIYKLNTFGSFIGHENNPNDWTLIHQQNVIGNGKDEYTYSEALSSDNKSLVPQLQRQAFYIEVVGSTLEYNEIDNKKTGDLFGENQDMQIFIGISNNNNFGNYSNNKPFVGRIYYYPINCDNFVMVNGMSICY